MDRAMKGQQGTNKQGEKNRERAYTWKDTETDMLHIYKHENEREMPDTNIVLQQNMIYYDFKIWLQKVSVDIITVLSPL